ncbi:hypothetical protein TNCV_349871 [Trichonephila clavipes]|nr:hypothetical protein TNCV_349871 [Trichonephila clavipes]
MALAVSDIDSFEPCNISGCPHHEKNPQNSPLKMTQSTPKINPHVNNSGKRKDNSNFEYPPLRKTSRKIILDIPDNEEINLSPNKFALPQGVQINNLEKELNGNSGAPDLRRGLNLLSNTWGVALKILLALVKIKWKKIVLDC